MSNKMDRKVAILPWPIFVVSVSPLWYHRRNVIDYLSKKAKNGENHETP